MILIFEDDADRIERFTKSLQVIDRSLPLLVWKSAKQMVRVVVKELLKG